jgi:outer membrane receptor for ferric coprogen and ferric-rhodotorulic acid
MNHPLRPAAQAVLLFLLGLAAPSTWAQSTAATTNTATTTEAPTSLRPVVVTGSDDPAGAVGYRTRRSDSALGFNLQRREIPQSMSVITQTQIEDFGLFSVHDLLALVTGVNVERVETDRTYYTARGFDITNFQFDGVGMPFTNGSQWGDLDTAAFERVDVLRGANGLLSSTGNPSATVNFVRKRPTRDFQASAAVTVGSWNRKRGEADLSGPLNAEGTVRGRLIVAGEKKDSYLDRYGSEKTLLSGAIDADLAPGTRLSVGLLEQHNDARSPMWGALPLHDSNGNPTNYDVSTSTAADWAFWNNRDRRANVELTHELANGWQVKASALRRTLRADSELFYVYGTPDATTGLGLYAYPSQFQGDYAQTTGDVRLTGPYTLGGRKHELLLGAAWGHERASELSNYGQGIGTALPGLAGWDGAYPKPTFDAGTDGSSFDTTRRSLYAATRLNPAEGLKVVLGANATSIHSSGINYGVAHAYDASVVTPYAGVVVDLGDTVSAYASVTRIFNPQTEVDVNHQVLAPIQGRSVEAGLKSEWLDKRLATSFAIFRTQQDNTAQAAGSFSNFQTYYAPVNATATGFEAELTGQLARGWEINGGYTQLRLRDDAGNEARTFVPRRTLRLATSYRPSAAPPLTLGAAVRHQSAISTVDGTATIRQGSYALLDLMARYDFDPHWSLTVNLNNVTDRKYLTSLYWTQAYYGAPRNVSATLRWTY